MSRLFTYAMPEDRILSNEGTSQRYGTRFDWDEDGLISLASLYRLAQVSVTAAQAAGGDIRGRQSAAIVVVTGKPTGQAWKDRTFDLRVDDSPEPLRELRRLVTLQRAYNHMNAGDLAVEKKDNEGALREYSAAEKLVPDNAEMIYWHAVALVNMGRVDESLPLFRKVFAMDRNWLTLTPRLPKSGLLPDDPKIIERIVAVGSKKK